MSRWHINADVRTKQAWELKQKRIQEATGKKIPIARLVRFAASQPLWLDDRDVKTLSSKKWRIR